jgi:hypothetical protein
MNLPTKTVAAALVAASFATIFTPADAALPHQECYWTSFRR